MSIKKNHKKLKHKLIKVLQEKDIIGRWFFFNRLVGKAYFKRYGEYHGPYSFGQKGQFDCYLYGNGGVVEIEFKGLGDELSKEQKKWISFCGVNNIPTFVLYEKNGDKDFNELREYLKFAGKKCLIS